MVYYDCNKKAHSGLCLSAWRKRTKEGYRSSIGLYDKMEELVAQLPKEYGAKIDHRIKRNMWFWVKPQYQKDARDYLYEKLGVECVQLEVSERWYIGH